MLDEKKIEWGLRPYRTDAKAFTGTRAILEKTDICWVPGRCSCQGDLKDIRELTAWTDKKALPALRKHLKKGLMDCSSEEVFRFEEGKFLLEASPRGSHGYLYMSTYLLEDKEGTDDAK